MKNIFLNRYELASRLLPKIGSLLDVGCRDAILRQYLSSNIIYVGADLVDGPGVDHVCNLEEGLPFQDSAFDSVVALDVLEHTNEIWKAYGELVRVADKHIIIILPNLYHWSLRFRYLLGREMGKYRLSVTPILDRHRWLVSYNSAREFSLAMASEYNLTVTEHVMFGPRRYIIIDMLLNLFSKNLGSWSVAFVFTKGEDLS